MTSKLYELAPLIKAFLIFNAYITAVNSFKLSLQRKLLPSIIGCALFITTQVILNSMGSMEGNLVYLIIYFSIFF